MSKPSDATEKALAEQFAELRQICEEEDYVLEVSVRENRLNPFEADEVILLHNR